MTPILDKTKIMSKVNFSKIWGILTPVSHSKFDNLQHLKPINLILEANVTNKLITIKRLIEYLDIVKRKMRVF